MFKSIREIEDKCQEAKKANRGLVCRAECATVIKYKSWLWDTLPPEFFSGDDYYDVIEDFICLNGMVWVWGDFDAA